MSTNITKMRVKGVVYNLNKLYDTTGSNVDGSMTQASITSELNDVQGAIEELGTFEESDEYIRIITDAQNRIIFGLKADGSVEWAVGVPTPVRTWVLEQIATAIGNIDLSGFATKSELQAMQNSVNAISQLGIEIDSTNGVLKIGGKKYKLIDYVGGMEEVYMDYILMDGTTYDVESVDGNEFSSVYLDAAGHIIYGVYSDDTPDLDNTQYITSDADKYAQAIEFMEENSRPQQNLNNNA